MCRYEQDELERGIMGNKNILINDDCVNYIQSGALENKNICIITDPPFNVGYHYNSYKDKMDEEEYISWLGYVVSSLGCPFIVIHYPESLYKLSFQVGRFPEKVVSWVYNSNTGKQHRDIAFFGIKPDFKKVLQPYKNPNDKRIKERIAKGIGGGVYMIGGILTKLKTFLKSKLTTPVLCH